MNEAGNGCTVVVDLVEIRLSAHYAHDVARAQKYPLNLYTSVRRIAIRFHGE